MRRSLWWMLLLAAIALGCRKDPDNTVTEVMPPVATAATMAIPPATATRTPPPTIHWITATATTATSTAEPTATPLPATATPLAPTATPLPPTATPNVVASCPPPAGWQPYLVLPGDTMGALAACVGASVADIAAANCRAPADFILAGEWLSLPGVCAPPTTATPGESGDGIAQVSPTIDPAAPDPGGETLAVSPTQAAPGQPVTVSLSGFTPNSQVVLLFQDRQFNQCDIRPVTVDNSGNAAYVLWIPGHFPAGKIAVTITTGNRQKSGDFTVIDSAAPLCGRQVQPTLTPTVESGSPTVEPPTVEPPTAEPPTAEPPTAELPTAEPPTAEPPTAEPPTTEPPTAAP